MDIAVRGEKSKSRHEVRSHPYHKHQYEEGKRNFIDPKMTTAKFPDKLSWTRGQFKGYEADYAKSSQVPRERDTPTQSRQPCNVFR
jgi:hypothetical protein